MFWEARKIRCAAQVSCTNAAAARQHSLEGRGLQAPGMARIKVQQAPHDQTPQAGSGAAQRPPPHSHADGGPHALRSAAAAGRRAPGVHGAGGGGNKKERRLELFRSFSPQEIELVNVIARYVGAELSCYSL